MRSAVGLTVVLLVVVAGGLGYVRLGRIATPVAYRLHLSPNMSSLSYTGNLTLDFKVNQDTRELWLDFDHSLELHSTSMMSDGQFPLNYPTPNRSEDRLGFFTAQDLKPTYGLQLNLTFSGRIRRDLAGFYLSTYTYNQTKRYLASTHFETSGARKTFPCFDEPAFRSKFTLEMSLDPSWKAISNTPIASDTISNGVRHVVFEEMENTPVYLIGWVVYQEDSFGPSATSPRRASTPGCGTTSVSYSLWASREYSGQDGLALSAAPDIVQKLENFTGIKCKAVTKKMDFVAIPDFSAGAMENWGIITFRESALLYDVGYSSEQDVLMIVAHELVHQWFGNLVTPDWWSYTWLSEGFARYLQYFIPHQLKPQLELDKHFLLVRRQLALETDGPSAHPLTNEKLETQADIDDMFDVITYDKGAAIIHMYRSLLTEEEFKKVINKYLTTVEGSGGVATPDMFFSSFPLEYANMSRWTETPGYPVVLVDETNSTITLSQYKIVGWNRTEPSDWPIPISIHFNNRTSLTFLSNYPVTVFNVTNGYSINPGQTGYFRTHYRNPAHWRSITEDVTMAIDDAFALAYAGLLHYNLALEVAFTYLKEHSLDYFVWATGLKGFREIEAILEGTEFQSNFTETVLSVLINDEYNKVLKYFQYNNENPNIYIYHKYNILKHACHYGHPDCLSAATKLLENISDANPVTRVALLCPAVQQGNSSTWEMIWNRYLSAKSPGESQAMLNALTCTMDRQLIKRLLDQLRTENVRVHDVPSMFSLICSRKAGFEEAFSFLKSNSKKIYNYLGSRKFLSILSSMKNQFNETTLAELKSVASSLELNLDSFITNVERSITWRKKVYEQLMSYYGAPSEENSASANYCFFTAIIIYISVLISSSSGKVLFNY